MYLLYRYIGNVPSNGIEYSISEDGCAIFFNSREEICKASGVNSEVELEQEGLYIQEVKQYNSEDYELFI